MSFIDDYTFLKDYKAMIYPGIKAILMKLQQLKLDALFNMTIVCTSPLLKDWSMQLLQS